MKQIFLSIIVFLGIATFIQAAATPGKSAPDFNAKGIDGKAYNLSDLKGKIVVLEAYNLDCPFCAHHYKTGAAQKLQKWATGKGVVWLVVNSVHSGHPSHRDTVAAKREWEKQKIQATAWINDASGKVGKAYGLRTTPHLVIIGKDAEVAYNGAMDDNPSPSGDPSEARNYVREALESLLAGKQVAAKSTKPYGCGVKYGS